MKLYKFRKRIQIFFFILFVIFFFFTVCPFASKISLKYLIRLEPFTYIVSSIASRQVLTGLISAFIIVFLTIILGRFFCSFVCPLGSLIDFSDKYIFGRFNRENRSVKPLRKIKYFILAFLITAALFQINLYFFAPLAIFPRSMTYLAFPWIINISNKAIDLVRPLFERFGLDEAYYFSLPEVKYWALRATGAMILLILFMGVIRKRFWCRYICPSGAFFGLLSKQSLFKRKVDSSLCNKCGICRDVCNLKAIKKDPFEIYKDECTLCGDCEKECPFGAISFSFTDLRKKTSTSGSINRKDFIGISSAALISIPLSLNLKVSRNNSKKVLRPPNSDTEKDFLAKCIRCGACIKVCKTNGLQPIFLENEFKDIYTPKLVPKIGHCEKECNLCSQVCPTNAIMPFEPKEKDQIIIGLASIDKQKCIVWNENKMCYICDEVCPFGAIEIKNENNKRGPAVINSKCTGCGLCENRCPVEKEAAIRVYPS